MKFNYALNNCSILISIIFLLTLKKIILKKSSVLMHTLNILFEMLFDSLKITL